MHPLSFLWKAAFIGIAVTVGLYFVGDPYFRFFSNAIGPVLVVTGILIFVGPTLWAFLKRLWNDFKEEWKRQS